MILTVLRLVLTFFLGVALLLVLGVVAFFGLGTLISHRSPGWEDQAILFFGLLGGLAVVLGLSIAGVWFGPVRRLFGRIRRPSGPSPD